MEEYGGLQENADVDLSEEDDWDNAEKRQFVRHARSVTATNCGDDGAARICAWMRVMEGECSIRRLFLRRQKGVAMSCKGATALAEMLRANKCLVELDLGNNRFEARFQKDVALIWNSCGIDIAFEHRIGAEGTTRLAEALRTNTTLRSLDLTGPPVPFIRTSNILSNGLLRVGVEGARVLGQVIGSGTCMLESLSLGRNSLGGEGLHALCSGLKSSSSLRALDVSGNLLDDDAIEDGLSMLLQSPCSLRVLDLTDNRITATGYGLLGELVRKNTSLTVLCVDEVQDDDAMLNLQHDIESTHALEHMDQVHKLAFCMAMHPRLGAKSSASLLDPEACSAVLDMCKMQVPRRLRTTHLQDMYSASRR